VQRYEAANSERKRQLEQDSALVLQLAAELETELEKTGHEATTPSAVRKAETIEKLAHTVKEKMKLTAAAG
jgi:DNA-directed RNA polymerase alpha subunit